MKVAFRHQFVLICLFFLATFAAGVQESASSIPEREIAALRKGLFADSAKNTSHVARRRALKNIVREAQRLIDASPQAPNRFQALDIIFKCQTRLVAIENDVKHRQALYDTCKQLVEAPDEYADVRLEADLILSEKRLTEINATLKKRAEALAALIERYRDTAAEARSLMLAGIIVQKLDSRDLERAIRQVMDDRFSDDLEVIEFRREHLKVTRLDVTFKGEFERLDGTRLSFPVDTMGHLCLMVFWAKNEKTSEPLMVKIKEYEEKYPGRFDVFSFNVDELPDAGESILRDRGLNWAVMKLPGGRMHPAYRAYARGDAIALLVNAYGKTLLMQAAHMDATGWIGVQTDVFAISEERISSERHLSQLRWLFIGDFLVESGGWQVTSGEGPRRKNTQKPEYPETQGKPKSETPNQIRPPTPDTRATAPHPASSNPGLASELEAIKNCFVQPPFRYRLTREEALQNYTKAEKLCGDCLDQGGAPSSLWPVRNRRIIALFGMWNLTTEPKYLKQAVAESETALAMDLSPEAYVVPRFALAKAAIRRNSEDADTVVNGFFADCGGPHAPASAVAAAAILALDAGSRELHDSYRSIFLDAYADDPAWYAFASFLRNRQHRFRLLTPNYTKRERWARGHVLNFGGEPMTVRFPSIELRQLDGQPFPLPQKTAGKLTILLFLEPPSPPADNYPVILDRHGKPNNTAGIRGMMAYAALLADKHVNQSIDVVAAFLCDDPERVGKLMAANEWTCQPALVPDGLKNPLVNRLGILSADRFPNVFLLRRDDTVAWWGSGLQYRDFGNPWVYQFAMKVHIEASEVDHGYQLLKTGDFKAAARVFSGPYLPWAPDRFGWRPVRYHGKALALMGAGHWGTTLEAIDTAIDAHKLRHFRGRRTKGLENWREDAVTVEMKQPCNTMAKLWETKAIILDKLGRTEEATVLRGRARKPIADEHDDVYAAFHEKLNKWRHKRQEL